MAHREVVHELVEVVRRDAGLHVRDDPRETLGREPPRDAHALELRLVLDLDRAGAARLEHRDRNVTIAK
jgi:hypothetical protein